MRIEREDLNQEAEVRILEAIRRGIVGSAEAMRPTVKRNIRKDLERKNKVRRKKAHMVARSAESDVPASHCRLMGQERSEAVRLARLVLDPEEDLVLVLRGMMGLSNAAAAWQLGWSVNKTSRRWLAAREKFQARFHTITQMTFDGDYLAE